MSDEDKKKPYKLPKPLRRAAVSQLRRVGYSQVEMAGMLRVSEATISGDVKELGDQGAPDVDPMGLYKALIVTEAAKAFEGDYKAMKQVQSFVRDQAELYGPPSQTPPGEQIMNEEALGQLIYKVVQQVLAEERSEA